MMSDQAYNEKKLLQASIKGDTAAFESIVRNYQSFVCAITYSATGDVGKSEELAQDAFINAWKGLGKLNDLGKFRGWLGSIARNLIRDSFKRKKRNVLDQAVSIDEIGGRDMAQPDPSEALISLEQQAAVSQALQEIPERYREPLVLFYRQEQSIKAVAEQMELSEGAVKTRLSRGRKLLKKQVEAMVETTISRTGPSKAFTSAVIATITGMVASSASAATEVTGATSSASTSIVGGLTAKIIAAAAAVIIGVGAVMIYQQIMQSPPVSPSVDIVSQKPEPEPEKLKAPAPVVAVAIEDEPLAVTPVIPEPAPKDIVEPVAKPAAVPESESIPDPVATVDADYEFKPKGVLSGLVTDSKTGGPVTDARLHIYIRQHHTVETDKNGFYSLEAIEPDGNYKIKIVSKDYVGITDYLQLPVIHLANGKQAVKHFQLDMACMIEVVVVDKAGDPIKGTVLKTTSLADDRKREVGDYYHTQKTDENGYVLLGGFSAAQTEYLITATHSVKGDWVERDGQRYRETKWDYAPGKLVVKLDDPEMIEYGEIVLQKGMEVKGYAEYSDGVPASGLTLVAYPLWWHNNYNPESCSIDPNGHFVIPYVTEGVYRMLVSIPKGEGRWSGYNVLQAELPLQNDELLVVKIPQSSPGSLASISGVINFVGEKRPEHVSINVQSVRSGRGNTELTPGPDGVIGEHFSIDRLEPGKYTLRVSGENVASKTIENVMAPSEGLEIDLEYIETPALAGRVIDGVNYNPVAQYRARARKLKALSGVSYVQGEHWVDVNDAGGQFSLDLVGPGVYQVQIAAEGYAWGLSEEVSTEEETFVKMRLTEGGSISGRVVNEEGEPIDKAKVIALSKSGGMMMITKEMFVSQEGSVETVEGKFVFENLAEGTETLKVIHPDYGFTIVKDIEVSEGRRTDGLKIVLCQGGKVEGFVYDVSGKPEANVMLYFQDKGGYSGGGDEEAGRLGMALTDPNGFYQVSGLPEQLCYVRRQNSWSSMGVVRRAIVPVSGKVSRLDFGNGAVVSGKLIVNGDVLIGSRVLLAATDNPYFKLLQCFSTTDKEGGFESSGVIPGCYGIYYESPQRRGKWIKVATITMVDCDIDLGVVPKANPKIFITIEREDGETVWDIDNLYLQESTAFWAQRSGQVKAPEAEGQPYVIERVTPGTYCLVVVRSDKVMFRETIEIGPEDGELTLTIPKGTARLFGSFVDDLGSGYLALWNKEKTVTAVIRRGEEDRFLVDDLPAGEYFIGGNMLVSEKAKHSFTLSAGEEKRITLDVSNAETGEVAALRCMALDDAGVPVPGAKMWLESFSGHDVLPTTNSSQGVYFITDPGEYRLHASFPGFEEVVMEVELELRDFRLEQTLNESPQFIKFGPQR